MEKEETRFARTVPTSRSTPTLTREEMVARVEEAIRNDEVLRDALVSALDAHRLSSASLEKVFRKALIDAASAPAHAFLEAADPTMVREHRHSLSDYWEKVGGYLGEAMTPEAAKSSRSND